MCLLKCVLYIHPGLDQKSVIESIKIKITSSTEEISQDIELADNKQPVASSSNIDKGKNPKIINLTPLLYISENWKLLLPSDIREKIKIMDETWNTDIETWTK